MDSKSITETTRWKIVTNQDNFEKLKTDESFWAVIALGRAVNALFFVHQALVPYAGEDSPASTRARYNSVLFSCAILAESFLLIQRIGKHFSSLPEFRSLSSLVNSKDARRIIESAFFGLRNKLVFHFDPEEIGQQLQGLKLDEPIFLSAMGRTNSQVHWELADLCAFKTLYGSSFPESDAALAESDFTRIASELITEFSKLAQEFIVAFLASRGWYGAVSSNGGQVAASESKRTAEDLGAAQSPR